MAALRWSLIDEAMALHEASGLAGDKIQDWLKTTSVRMRVVVLSTQSMADIKDPHQRPAILQSTATKIYLAQRA